MTEEDPENGGDLNRIVGGWIVKDEPVGVGPLRIDTWGWIAGNGSLRMDG